VAVWGRQSRGASTSPKKIGAVTVTRIAHLARSQFDLFAIVQRINQSGPVFRFNR
jgi:hypothetical protein